MIKAESKGERTLRSASPHRNAYKSDFHAIKCSFDGTKSDSEAKSCANGASDPREDSRGRPFGNRVNKIKNIFLQMDGQQPQESQDASPVSPVSPVSKFAVNTNKPNSANSQEPQNTDRTPKAEEVEIDKVALAEKFSVTRKLFERGIKDQPASERSIPGRASTRLSHGKVPDEGVRGSRRSFGSSENINTNSAIKTPPISPVRSDEKSIDESKQVNRLSLNAGPISRRLENFIVDGDNNKESTQVIPEKSSSPIRASFQIPSSPGTDSTQKPLNADSSPKPFSPKSDPISNISPISIKLSSSSSTGELTSPSTNHIPFKRSPSSSSSSGIDLVISSATSESTTDPKSPSSPCKSSRSPEELKSENHIIGSSSREQCLDPAGAGVVRAELVVVQNESSESEDDDDLLEDDMTEVKLRRELKSEAPIDDAQNHTEDRSLEKNLCLLEETKKRESNLEEETEEIIQKRRSSCDEDEDNDEDEESEQEDPDECGKTSPVFYSFENAAFVDDKEAEAVEDKQEDEDEDEELDEEYDEVPGLSEDEERPSRRTIRFSTKPIRVSDGLILFLF